MGNSMISCYDQTSSRTTKTVKLIFYSGETRVLTGRKRLAGEIMFEFPDHMVCHADSFFIGQPIPVLAMDDHFLKGETYFVLPLDCFSCTVLSTSSLASLGSSSSFDDNKKPARPMNFKECPLQYVKGLDGRVLIKVMPEFMIKLITRGKGEETIGTGNVAASPSTSHGFLCSTPELKKQYEQLVGSSKVQTWTPKLETISEYKIRYSPCRFIGFERKIGEA